MHSRDGTMDVQELQNVMAEYEKMKSIKVFHHQNGGTENRTLICYETEMEAQRAITEINSYQGWRVEKYIANKGKRTGNQFNERHIQVQEKQKLKKMMEKRPTKKE